MVNYFSEYFYIQLNLKILNQLISIMKKLLQSLFILLCIAQTAVAQNRTVTGTVTSSQDGTPLPGATVKIPGSKTGTLTSAEGRYSVSVPNSTTTLEFSYIGYVLQTKAC